MNRLALAICIACFPLASFAAIKTEPIPDLRPPRPELPPVVDPKSPLPWVLGGAGLAAITVLLMWPRRKPVPPLPRPFARAQNELAALRAEPARATPAAVSAIVRRYVVAVFCLPGEGATTGEIASGLAAGSSCPPGLADAVGRFLGECDVAKFAPGAGAADSAELLARAAKLLAELEACLAVPAPVP